VRKPVNKYLKALKLTMNAAKPMLAAESGKLLTGYYRMNSIPNWMCVCILKIAFAPLLDMHRCKLLGEAVYTSM
jgi:hypothetical protein